MINVLGDTRVEVVTEVGDDAPGVWGVLREEVESELGAVERRGDREEEDEGEGRGGRGGGVLGVGMGVWLIAGEGVMRGLGIV